MSYNVMLAPSGKQIVVEHETTILDAAVRDRIGLPHGCRDGSCGQCKSRLLTGHVSQPKSLGGISDEELAEGYILTCVAEPTSDIEIESTYYPELDGIEAALFPCKADSIDFPVPDIAIVRLRLPPNSEMAYLPGQYLDLMWKGMRRSYSIANIGRNDGGLELHIRRFPDGKFSQLIFKDLSPGMLLRIHGPHGTFFVRKGDSPIIFLAGGTGFAPIKAMVEQLLDENSRRSIHIYWGVSSADTLYSQLPDLWQENRENISFTPVLSGNDSSWQGRRGLVHAAVMHDFTDLSEFELYACGSLDMVTVAKANFLDQGLLAENFFSDAFTPFRQTS